MIKNVLVVCEGNVCRSPLAAVLLKQALPDIQVFSSGTRALVGEPADQTIVALAKERGGVSLDDHVATQLTADRVSAADLILVMTNAQRVYLENTWPSSRGKVFRLAEDEGVDITDPYRRHRSAFELSYAQIEQSISRWSRVIAGQ